MSKYNKRGERNEENFKREDLNDNWISPKDNKVPKVPSKKKKKKVYWFDDTENAVVEYLYINPEFWKTKIRKALELERKKGIEPNPTLMEEWQLMVDTINGQEKLFDLKRDKIFRERMRKPLYRLVENIMFNFGLFRNDVDIKTQQEDCITHVLMKMVNFDPEKKNAKGENNKAYSFLGTIAKHYLMNEKRSLYEHSTSKSEYESVKDEADSKDTTEIDEEIEVNVSLDFFNYVYDNIEKKVDKGDMSSNDIVVADAILKIFKSHAIIGKYGKTEIYQDIKEATGLETKDITYSLGRLKVFYKLLKQDFIELRDAGLINYNPEDWMDMPFSFSHSEINFSANT